MGGAPFISKVFASPRFFGKPHLDMLWRTVSQVMVKQRVEAVFNKPIIKKLININK